MIQKPVIYFEKPGKANTDDVIEAVKKRVSEGDINHIVVSTSTGNTALKLYEALDNFSVAITAVTLHSGFKGGDSIKMTDEMRKQLSENGIQLCIGSHSLSGVGRSISNTFGGTTPVEIIAHTLRAFCGHGMKVCVEIAIMAADAFLIPTDSTVIAIGGTGGGVDTAVTMKAAHANNFFDLHVKEILSKPINVK